LPQVLPAERTGRHRPDAASCRQDQGFRRTPPGGTALAVRLKSRRESTMKIAVLPGDGIGKEIVAQAMKVLRALDLGAEFEQAPVGGAGYEAAGDPLPEATLALAQHADAILFGAIGDPRYDTLERAKRPEQSILRLRQALQLFANLRPATMHAELVSSSTLGPEVVANLALLIVRELTGDIYFGQPRGIRMVDGEREGF